MIHSKEFLLHWFHMTGVFGIWGILFLEVGVFLCFFFPGDSLLFLAGVLASQQQLALISLIVGSIVAVFFGYLVGYLVGKQFGHWLRAKKDTWYFKQKYLTQADAFYAKHGIYAVFMNCFVPVVRTFGPIVAGIAGMPFKKFMTASFFGSCVWVTLITLIGYFFGSRFHNIGHLMLPLCLGIVLITLIPLLVVWLKNRKSTK